MAGEELRIHIVPHSHIDTEWYWTGEEGRVFGARALRAALGIMERDPRFRFCQDQVTVLEPAVESLPRALRSALKNRIASGAFEIVGGMYVQPEVAEPAGECLIRQILEGRRWFKAELASDPVCAWNIDTFGQCTQLPQILSKSGYRCFVFGRGVPPELSPRMPSEFLYRSPDGSTILTHWMSGHYCGSADNVEGMLRAASEHRSSNVILLPWGCDITYPRETSAELTSIVRKAAERLGIKVEWAGVSTPSAFFADLVKHRPHPVVVEEDFNPPLGGDLRGTYDNRIELKKTNRRVESLLLQAEALSTLAWVKGCLRKHDLSDDWRRLLYNHFHDIIGGSHHDAVYRAAMERLDKVKDLSERLALSSAEALCGAREDRGKLLVVNPSSLTRTEVCSFSLPPGTTDYVLWEGGVEHPVRSIRAGSGGSLAFFLARDLPSFGFRSYDLKERSQAMPAVELRVPVLENADLFVELDPATGHLSRLIHKASAWQVLSGPGNELVALEEENPDLEGELRLTGRSVHSGDFPAPGVRAFRDGLGSWAEIDGEFLGCRRVQRVYLWDGLPRIDFETELVGYSGGDWMVEVHFPLNLEWDDAKASYETPFAVTQRKLDEHYCAQTFVDCSDRKRGAALVNGGTPGCWARSGSLDMVILRSFSAYGGYAEGRRRLGLRHDDPDSRCVLAQERGNHACRYSLYPYVGSWRSAKVPSVAHSYNSAPICIAGMGSARSESSFLSAEPKEFEIVCLKPGGDDLIVRGYDTSGLGCDVRLHLPFEPRAIWRANLLEEPLEALPHSGTATAFHCGPHEIVTLRISR